MIVKEILEKANCVVLISKEGKIVADNVDIMGNIEKYENEKVVALTAFYARSGVYKYGLTIGI